jgi:fibronectin type 3 domain-containing protein
VGIGGAGGGTNAGGGGGGYFGGYGSGQNPQQWRYGSAGYSGGGGGSSWTQSSARFVSHTQGFKSGNGALIIYAPQTGSLDAPRNFEVYGYQAFNLLNWTPSPESAVTGYRVAWGTSQGVLSQFINIPGRLSQSFLHHGNNFAVTNKAITTNVATLTTSANHGIAIGDEFIVQGVGTPFDGTYVATTGTTGTTLRYSLVNANISAIAVSPTGNVSKTKALTINTTYYYEVTALYADASRTCNTACESASSSQRYATPIFTRDVSFTSNGSVQTFTVPDGVTWLQVDAVGASGGTGATGIGGKGGRVQGVIPVTQGEVLYLYVGGKGGGSLVATQNIGGWNGGGNGSGAGVGGGGGGSTDIRRNKLVVTNKIVQSSLATLTTAETHGFSVGDSVIVAGVGTEFNGTFTVSAINAVNKTFSYAVSTATLAGSVATGTVSGPSAFATAASLATRVVVAGGGGGGGNVLAGGVGGGLIAGQGVSNSCDANGTGNCSGLGGSQTYGRSLGIGGVGTVAYSGGGGGGYWGGWAAGNTPQLDRTGAGGYSGGGGGSSYTASDVLSSTDARTISGVTHTQGFTSAGGSLTLSVPTRAYPTGVNATGWTGYNTISWDSSEISGATQYRVYGGTSQNPTSLLAKLPVETTSFNHHGATFAVTNKSLTSNVVTLTTASAHGMTVGANIVVSGIDPLWDGVRTITANTATTVSFAFVAANVASTPITAGTVQLENGLTLGTQYFYRVSIVTGSIESEKSTEVTATPTFSSSQTFASIDAVQRYTVPVNVSKIFIDARGAQGATGATGVGGRGGRTQGAIDVTPGEVLYIYVGEKGGEYLASSMNLGGWNGGGNGNGAGTGGGGGGATDIRRNRLVVTNKIVQSNLATLTTAETHGFSVGDSVIVAGVGTEFNGTFTVSAINAVNKTFSYAVSTATLAGSVATGTVSGPSAFATAASLATRVVVAGGGGGGGNVLAGGVGGGLIAGQGVSNSCDANGTGNCSGLGGSQTYGRSLGIGGVGTVAYSGGGGGGYWGGWAAGNTPQLDRTGTGGYSGGGGGSSYTAPEVSAVLHAQGVNSGDGQMVISWSASPVVTGVQATPLNAAVTLSWNESSLSGLSGYRVYGGTSPNPTTVVSTVSATTPGYTHTGLTNGTTYYYRVTAIVTANGRSNETPVSGDVSGTPTTLTTNTYSANGTVRSFVVPAGVLWLQADAIGAQGGTGATGLGGKGGRVQGAIPVTPGETLYLYVGGNGSSNIGGWNGGGNGNGAGTGGGGGGATDIRRNNLVVTNKIVQASLATLTTAETHGFSIGDSVIVTGVGAEFDGTFTVSAVNAVNKTFSYTVSTATYASRGASGTVTGPSTFATAASLATRVLVAGGGGGGGNNKVGGVGGGLTAGEGDSNSCGDNCSGLGGSQTYGSSLGRGGVGTVAYSGGGGGGYWGGWAAGNTPQLARTGNGGYSGGGGGSSYTATEVAVPVHTQGYQTGAGSLSLSYSVDTTAPVVTGISSPNPTGNYTLGKEISINVAYSKAVVVSGTPTLTLNAGTRDVVLNYVSGSGSSSLLFTYVVAQGDLTTQLDIKATDSLDVASGLITDRAGNAAVNTLPTPGSATSLAGSKLLSIDGIPPVKPTVLSASGVDGISLDWADNSETDLQEYRIYSCSGLVASSCSSPASFSVLSSVAGGTSTFDHIAVGRGITYYYYVTAVDRRGNEGPASDVVSWFLPVPVLVATPSVVAVSPTNDLTPEITGVADAGATVYLYLDGSATPLGSVTAANTGAYSFSPPSNITAGTHTFRARATVVGVKTGSSGFSNEQIVLIDTTAPTFTSNNRSYPTTQTTGLDVITFRWTFSEALSGLDTSDIAVSGSTATASSVSMVSGLTGVYDVTVSGGNLAGYNGVLGIGFVSSPTVTDIAGNSLTGINPGSPAQTYSMDNSFPPVTITSSASTLGGTSTATLTFTLGQSSTDFELADIDVAGGTLSAFTGSGTTYTATFTPRSGFSGTATVSVDGGSFSNASGIYNSAGSVNLTVDTTSPSVLSVQSTSTNGIYKTAGTINVTVTFDESIVVATGAGVPTLLLETGTVDRAATFVSSSGPVATFRYVVQAGDVNSDLDVQSSGALVLNGGTIRDAAGNAANLAVISPGSTGSLGANAAIVVDTVAPVAPTSLSSIGVGGITASNKLTATNTDLTATATIVAGDATGGSATLYLDGVSIATDNTILVADTTVSFALGKTTASQLQAAVSTGGVLTAKLTDAAGNVSSASTNVTLSCDYVVPTIQLSSSRSTLIAGQTATITATLSETSINFTSADVSVTGGAVSGFTGSGTSYSFVFTPTSSSTAPMSVQVLAGVFSDAVGNVNAASSDVTATVDTVLPTVSGVSSVIANGSYRAGAAIDVTVTFTENVVVTTTAGTPTVLMETGATDRPASYVSGSGTSVITFRYVVQTGDISSDLDVQSSSALALNGGFIRDASGNDAVRTLANPGVSGSLGSAKAIVVDTVAPSTPTSLVVTPVGVTVVANTLLADNTNMTATATITAGQATGGWAELVLGSTTIATDTSILSGDTSVAFNLGFSVSAHLQAAIAVGGQLTVRVIDAAGNVSSSSQATNLIVDYVKPTATLSSSRSTMKIGETATITVQLSEASSTFVLSDVTVTGGTVGTFVAVSSTQYTFVLSPASSVNGGSAALSLAGGVFTDTAGNTNTATAALSLSYDTSAPPVPVVSGTSPVITNDATPTLSGTAESGATVVISDSSTTPSTVLATVIASGGTWSFDASTLSEGSHLISAVATDAAGNTSASSTAKTWQIDTTPPTVSLSTIAGNDTVTRAEKDAGVSVSGSVESGASVVLQFAGLSKTITPTSGTWTYLLTASDWTAIASSSPIAFVVTATDTAANTASRTRNVVMNLANIAVPGNPDLIFADDTGDFTDNVTTNRTIRIDVPLVNAATPSHEVGQLLQLIDGSGVTVASRVLAAADIAAGVYQFTLHDLNDDEYVLQSRVSNLGNSAVSASTLSVRVDNRVPGTPGAPNMTDATDSGISARDNVTSELRPEFSIAINGIAISGSALVAGDSIILYNGSTSVRSRVLTTADIAAGFVALQPVSDLAEGQNVLTAKAQSVAGTIGGSSVALSIVVDTTAQSSPAIPDLIAADDTGASSSDNSTSITQPNFSIALSGLDVVANDQVQLLNSGGLVIGTSTVSSVDVANGNVLITPVSSFSDGAQVLKVRIVDRAGNVGALSPSLTISISTNIPNATTPALQAVSDTGRSSSDRITQRTTPTFTGTGTSGDTIKLFDGSQLLGTGQVVSGTWSITVPALSDGSYTLRALVIDNAGNESSFSSGLGITVDTLRPVAPVITGSPLLSRTATPVVSGTAEAFAIVNVYEGLHLIGTATADGLGNWTLTASSLIDQSYSLKASATDFAGNTSTDSASVSLLVDTITPTVPTVNSITTYSLTQSLSGTGEPGATLTISDGASSIGSVTVSVGGTWTFTTPSLSNAAHSFTATQSDAVGNTSQVSAPARTIASIQMAALHGANGIDDNSITASASQYGADGITDINTAAKASLLNDVIDVLPATSVDTYAEIAALAAIVKSIFATAAGEVVVPALTPQDLAALGIMGVDADNIDSVIAAIAGTADNGSGVDSLDELTTLVDAALAASRAAITIISGYDGSNTTPGEANFTALSVTDVSASNISSVNSVLAVLSVAATDSRAEVQSIVNTYVAILNAADGTANSGLALTAANYQNIGLTDITSSSQANLFSSILDSNVDSAVDTYSELQILANIVARLFITAAGGNPTPPITAAELALIGINGVTSTNLSSVLSTIAATTDNGSGIDDLAKLQGVVDTGIANARSASQAIITNYDGTNTVPTLDDFVNVGVTGVISGQIAAINTFIAVRPTVDTDSQAEVQAIVDAYAKLVSSANGLADGGLPLSAIEFATLGLSAADLSAEVNLLNDLIDVRPGTAVDSYVEVAALASIVTRFIGEAAGVASSPALTPADFVALGISGVTAENLAEVLIVIRASADDGSELDTLTELRTLVDAAVALSRQNAIDTISRYDGTSATTTPALADFANAGVTGVTNGNLVSINSAFAVIGIANSDATEEIQGLVSGYVTILLGADGQRDSDVSLSSSDYVAMNLARVDTSGKADLLNQIFDGLLIAKVDTYSELQSASDVVADIFLTATGAQPQSELTVARLEAIGLSGISSGNIALLVAAIANTSDDTLGVDSFAEVQAIVNQVRASQVAALAVISAYDGTNTVPTVNTLQSAGITGVDSSNIGIINQYLATMSAESTDSVAEVQALVDALSKLMICADGTANENCTFTITEFHAMGYLDIDTQEEMDALNIDLDTLDLTPTQESFATSEAVTSVINRFKPVPVTPVTPVTPVVPEVSAPTTTTVPPSTTTTTTIPVTSTTTTVPLVVPPSKPAATTVPTPTTVVPATTTVPILEVLPGSGGIQMAPGKAGVFINGKLIDLTVVINEDNSATVELLDKFVLRITPARPENTVVVAGETLLLIYRNQTVAVQGKGFAKDAVVEVWINSTPIMIGTTKTDADGAFNETLPLPEGIEVGEHTLTVSGELADGTMGKISIGAIVIDSPETVVDPENNTTDESSPVAANKGGVPYNPQSEPKSVVSLLGDMAGLMALAGLAVAGRRQEKDEDGATPDNNDNEEDRGSGEVAEVSAGQHETEIEEKADILRPPRSTRIDRLVTLLPLKLSRVSPLVGRVLVDGTYLRSLFGVAWLLMPLLGVVVGVGSALSTDFNAVMPSLVWLIAVVIIGSFDALAGFMAASIFGVLVVVGGGIQSTDSVRGLLGIWVFSFAVPMLASAARPFRRQDAHGIVGAWDRTADFVMIVLFGAWGAGSMFSALPGLTGFRPSYADDVSRIQVIVLVALIIRYVLENVTTSLTPARLRELSTTSLPSPSNMQVIVSSLTRTTSYVFVAIVFIGNNWALWTGAVLYLLPKLVAMVDDKFPNIDALHRYMPRGILKLTFMMFVARWWGQLLADNIEDAEKMITFGFVFLGMPGFITTVMGWFGRSSSRDWEQNWFTRISGLVLLIVGFLIVRGVLLG